MTVLQDTLNRHDVAEIILRHEEAHDLRARVVRVDGTTERVWLTQEDRPEQINKAIGSGRFDCIEVVARAEGKPSLDCWIDDEGLFTKAPNIVASAMLRWFTDVPHTIHGDVIFTGGPDSEGDMLPLTRIQDAILSDIAKELAEKARQIHLV